MKAYYKIGLAILILAIMSFSIIRLKPERPTITCRDFTAQG